MKNYLYIHRISRILKYEITCIFLCLLAMSCIKEAPLNIEADILAIDYDPSDFFSPPEIKNSEIRLFFNQENNNIGSYALKFKLSRGATSNPASGTIQDFSSPIEYVITSENKLYQKKYTVIAVDESTSFVPLTFDFENYRIEDSYKYTVFFDKEEDRSLDTWSSGNAGFVFSLSPIVKKQPELYPMQFTSDAHQGDYAAKLVTKSTGTFGVAAKKPIAAGNIFLGDFDSGNVLGDPLKSTKFGIPIIAMPISLEGWYRYIPGDKVIDQDGKPLAEVDSCSIVAVLFDAEELRKRTDKVHLDGSNILTDPSILGSATLYDGVKTSGTGYKKFLITLDYSTQPKTDDFKNGRYRVAIVLSASKNGDRFVGAVGSTLFIDDLKINVK